ncbi:hypothetical protein Ptr902_05626 [Pyrenophora tritici-repentis]|nr:hypothetical protein Ptr902_05626 [Pyrenophora tritici-repentis]
MRDSTTSYTSPQSNTKRTRESIRDALDIHVLGVCSGSGLIQLDCALVRYRQASPRAALRLELVQYGSVPTSSIVRNQILASLREVECNPTVVAHVNTLLGCMFSNGIKTFCHNYGVQIDSIDMIGTHMSGLRRVAMPESDDLNMHTLGWNVDVTANTGVTTVFDFAVIETSYVKPHVSPVAFVNRIFLRHPFKFRACLPIGELVNCSFIPPWTDGSPWKTYWRDCGPGSLLVNYAVRYCTSNNCHEDNNGKLGMRGMVNQAVVKQFLAYNDYSTSLPSPRIAREMFGDHEAQRLIDTCLSLKLSRADIIATITRITAENMLRQYCRLLALGFSEHQTVEELFISGPSARNTNIIDYLEAELPESVITKPLDDIGIPGDANEAVCYAHLALEAVLGVPIRSSVALSWPPIQVGEDVVLGRVVQGMGWGNLSSRLQNFGNGKPRCIARHVKISGNMELGFQNLGLTSRGGMRGANVMELS